MINYNNNLNRNIIKSIKIQSKIKYIYNKINIHVKSFQKN